MSQENPLRRLTDLHETTIDNVVYNLSEDPIIGQARVREFNNQYGNIHLVAWVPGIFAYTRIKKTLNDSRLTTGNKAARIGIDLACELTLDLIRFGSLYGLYTLATN